MFLNVENESSDPLLIFEDHETVRMMQKKMKKKRINQFDDFVTMILNDDESSDPLLIFEDQQFE